jgi:DNA-nicking Smr family endonuclease
LNKIKIPLQDNRTRKKRQSSAKQSVRKITISFNDGREKENKTNLNLKNPLNKNSISPETKKTKINKETIAPFYDKNIHKFFKKNNFYKLDLHGHTLESAKTNLYNYCYGHFKRKNLLHIIVTGLGNKSDKESFFSGKIRNSFSDWINQNPLNEIIKSYHPCKIQHGGLGAFYIKIKSIK